MSAAAQLCVAFSKLPSSGVADTVDGAMPGRFYIRIFISVLVLCIQRRLFF